MKRQVFILLFVAIATNGFAKLTIDQCHQLAHDNYPAIKKYNLIEQSCDFTVSNAIKGYLPNIKVSTGVDAFTDIISLPSQLQSATGSMKNDIADVNVQVNQTLYDGGAIQARKHLSQAQADVDKNRLDVTMYTINDRIDQLFFGILTIDEQIKQNMILQSDLSLNLKTIENMIKGGLANQTDADIIKVEQIKDQQAEKSLRISRQTYLYMLGTFIGRKLDYSTTLEIPEQKDYPLPLQSKRPELELYSAQDHLLNVQKESVNAQIRPKLSAFGLGMYHSQVSSLMKNHIFAAGITLSWNLSALYTHKNDLRNIEIQRQEIANNREIFLFDTNLQSQNVNGKIKDMQQQIEQDKQIIALREGIYSKSIKKVENGTETTNEMVRDINAVNQARQQKAVHEILLLQEIYQLKNINND
ncbi:MAG: TolC family protein [Prevotella sp.]|jgi:outer membrane protein TolC|nr:TolC family protein [Prevotella sp.]